MTYLTSTDCRVDGTHPPLQIVHDTSHTGEKRRPGRPRGSKNRKPRAPRDRETNSVAPVAVTGPPPHPDINSQNQQYYEFQWRILNLCAEFYGAAEELVVRPLRHSIICYSEIDWQVENDQSSSYRAMLSYGP